MQSHWETTTAITLLPTMLGSLSSLHLLAAQFIFLRMHTAHPPNITQFATSARRINYYQNVCMHTHLREEIFLSKDYTGTHWRGLGADTNTNMPAAQLLHAAPNQGHPRFKWMSCLEKPFLPRKRQVALSKQFQPEASLDVSSFSVGLLKKRHREITRVHCLNLGTVYDSKSRKITEISNQKDTIVLYRRPSLVITVTSPRAPMEC